MAPDATGLLQSDRKQRPVGPGGAILPRQPLTVPIVPAHRRSAKNTLPMMLRLPAALLFVSGLVLTPAALAQEAAPPQAEQPPPPPPMAPPTAPPPKPVPAEERPFELSGVEVASERDRPQACFTFTRSLPRPQTRGKAVDLSRFVTVEPAQKVTVTARDRDLCLEGLAHGQRYAITIKAGFQAAGGREKLAEAVTREVQVADRKPSLSFRGQGYMLPRIGGEGLPLRGVNVDRVRLQVLRVNDRALVEQIYYGRINQTMTDFEVGDILDQKGQVVWKGEMAMGGQRNRTTQTPFPVDAVLGTLSPGVYVAVAENAALPMVAWDQRATQWFVVSDVGLTSFKAANGLYVFARSLAGAKPLPGVELRLVARNKQELGRTTTGADGMARFDAAQVDGRDERTPQALFAAGPDGGFSLLDFGAPVVELAGRGDGGRATPGAADAFLFSERGAYRPGDAVYLTGLLRDADSRAVTGQKLTVKLLRPDGLEVERRVADDMGAGGHLLRFELPANAPAGRWTVTAHLDPTGPAIGRTQFNVGEVTPTRLEFSLSSDRPRIGADGKLVLSIDGRYLMGDPAARLPGELTLMLRPAEKPYPELEGYRFGLVQKPLAPEKRALPGFTTGPDGKAQVSISLNELPETSRPMEAVLRATLHDIGGRSVDREIVLPVDHQAFALGLKPNFTGDAVPEGATVSVQVAAVGAGGKPQARKGLSWELFEEEYDYEWYAADGRWEYRTIVKDRRLTGGSVDAAADKPGLIEEQVRAGRYRLEVFDPGTGVASSLRFSAGWWVSAKMGDTPDAVEVAVQQPLHEPGGTARVFVRPPYAGTVAVALADRAVRHTVVREIGTDGAFLDLPIPADVTAGAYVLVTAFAPADPASRTPPRRAVGSGWVAVDPAQRTLTVDMAVPDEVRPRGQVTIPVTIAGATPGENVRLALLAVDDEVAKLPESLPIDPVTWFLGKRRLSVELRDVYGRLAGPAETPVAAAPPALPVAADTASRGPRATNVQPVPRSGPVTSIHSGIVTVAPDGKASVTLTLPDMQGRLALTAIAWSDGKVGKAQASMLVRDAVTAQVSLPGFLAPGDKAQITFSLENMDGPRGTYKLTLGAEGPVRLEGGRNQIDFKALAKGGRVTATRTLLAGDPGYGVLVLTVTGPEGYKQTRRVPVNIRPAHPLEVVQTRGEIAPGATLALNAPKLPGPVAGAASRIAMVGPRPVFDAPAHLLALDSRPFGSADQLAARLLPLTDMNDWAKGAGLPADNKLKAKADDLVERLIGRQRSDGAFSLWSLDGPADVWLTAFALDVLTRAKEAEFAVPEDAYRRGMDYLVRSIGNSWIEDAELPARAYALYTAARARAIDTAPLRFFQETFAARVPTRLARAQLGAAFATLGEGEQAAAVLSRLDDPLPAVVGLHDYGTLLRDRAAILALLVGAGASAERVDAEQAALQGLLRDPMQVSTQERAWLLVAARALATRGPGINVTVDGQSVTGNQALMRALAGADSRIQAKNNGDQPLHVATATAGILSGPDEEVAQGITLNRQILDAKGKKADLARIRNGDLLVVLLEGKADRPINNPLLLIDPLPGGLVVENVRLAGSAQLGDLSWLGELSDAALVEFRDDRFVAALDGMPEGGTFRLVYLARAVTPGTFALPSARLDDLVDGARFARTGSGTLTVGAKR